MKFAVAPRILPLTLAIGLALILAGCGFGSSNNNNNALSNGNWSISATSTTSSNAFLVGGKLTQNGSTVSGKMYITGADPGCNIDPDQAVTITGTASGSSVALTSSSISDQVITIAGSGSGSSFNGTYVIAGGNCDGDEGTVSAHAVASVSGTWSGEVQVSGDPHVQISIALTQATTASADGTFALTGTVTYTGSVCDAAATVLSTSRVAGANIVVDASVGDGEFSYRASLDSVAAPHTMVGDYETSDTCAGDDIQTPTLTKQ